MKASEIIQKLQASTNLRKTLREKPAGGWGEDWGCEPWRAPKIPSGVTLLCELPGRVIRKVDYRSHYYRLVGMSDRYICLYRHCGTGEDFLTLDPQLFVLFDQLGEDDQYLFVNALYEAMEGQQRRCVDSERAEWQKAVIEGRIRKRRTGGRTVVEILDPSIKARLDERRDEKRAAKRAAEKVGDPDEPVPVLTPVERQRVVIKTEAEPFI